MSPLAVFPWLLLALDSASAFEPGAICDGLCNVTSFATVLRGKHVMVGDIVQSPLAIYDSTLSGSAAWSGLGIDLFERVASLLGFSYTIQLITPNDQMTESEQMLAALQQSDLILNYWNPVPALVNRSIMLRPIYYTDMLLIVHNPVLDQESLSSRMFTCFKPFSLTAWFVLVASVVVAGVALYWLEEGGTINTDDLVLTRQQIAKSVYLAFGLLTGTASHSPKTRGGRLVHLTFGFALMVVLAAYTASLAAFLTVKATPVSTISSIDDVQIACIKEDSAILDKATKMYLQLTLLESYPESSVLDDLRAGKCDAALTSHLSWQLYSMEFDICDLNPIGAALTRGAAGWVASSRASCLANAVDYALSELAENGVLAQTRAKYLTKPVCKRGSSSSNSATLHVEDFGGLYVLFVAIIVVVWVGKCGHAWKADLDEQTEGSRATEPEPPNVHSVPRSSDQERQAAMKEAREFMLNLCDEVKHMLCDDPNTGLKFMSGGVPAHSSLEGAQAPDHVVMQANPVCPMKPRRGVACGNQGANSPARVGGMAPPKRSLQKGDEHHGSGIVHSWFSEPKSKGLATT